jgi:predicted secreted protein
MSLSPTRPYRPALPAILSRLAAAGLLAAAALPSLADPPAPQGVVNLSASASTEVAQDWLRVNLSTRREGSEATPVQNALKQALDAALQEARKAARPGQLEVQAGNFSLVPRYGNQGQANGWQGNAELVIEGRDMAAIAQLTGRITGLSIAQVSYSLSREQRQKAEGEVTAQAVTHFRARATEAARLFGYGSYLIREVSLSSNEPAGFTPMLRGKAMSAMASAEALPVEAGRATVTVTVQGSVQLLK